MRSRRSVRRFKSKAPDRVVLERLLEAAAAAPSASNKQPWRFVVVRNRACIERMAAAVQEAVERTSAHIAPDARGAFEAYGDYFVRFKEAPVVIVVLHRALNILSQLADQSLDQEIRASIAVMESGSGLIGAAMSIQNLLLMAHAEGLGASGMTGPLIAAPALRTILTLPESWEITALVPVGYPDETPPATSRRGLDKIVRWIE